MTISQPNVSEREEAASSGRVAGQVLAVWVLLGVGALAIDFCVAMWLAGAATGPTYVVGAGGADLLLSVVGAWALAG